MRDGQPAPVKALEFRLLGPLEVVRDSVTIDLGPAKQRAVLAVLILHARQVVSTDRLIDEVWGADPPPTAAHALQVYISKLRSLLEPGRSRGATGEVLRTRRPGYVLDVPNESIDIDRFETWTERARAATSPAVAGDYLREALALWRGAALADFAYESFAQAEAARLEELRLAALADRIQADLECGRHVELVGELEALVVRHPTLEHFWFQLATALYRSGRQADALDALARLRRTLADELGIDPSPQLRELEESLLRQAPSLSVKATEPPTSPSVVRDERRVVTALAADLVGSTTLGEQLDPADFKLIIDGAIDRMVASIAEYGGTIEHYAGDGVLALFGAPEAHEDDVERGLRAALGIASDVAAYGEEVARAWDIEPIRVRIGVNTGPIVLGGPADQRRAFGDAVNTAARLESAAPPGGILACASTRRLAEPLFEWGPPVQLELRGKARPVAASPLLRARAESGKVRGLPGIGTELIGRDRDLAIACEAIEGVIAGAGGILLVTGEAGTGKSRLLAELRRRFEVAELPQGRRGLWLEGRCLSYGETRPYWPFREILREWLGTPPGEPELRTKVTLQRKLSETLGDGAEAARPILSTVVGVSVDPDVSARVTALGPSTLQSQTFETVRGLIERLTADGPVVVAVDDLHWSDPSSLALLESLLDATDTCALLIVAALRLERQHGSWRIKEVASRDLAHRTVDLSLAALSHDDSERLLGLLIGQGSLPPAVSARVLAAADGNPFFLEELIRSLVDTGALVRDGAGWTFVRDVPIDVPGNVEKVLLSRIDRLAPSSRDVLQAAAVVGRQFAAGVIEAMCVGEADVRSALGELQRLDLIRETHRWPESMFRFQHPLVQEVVYRSLLDDRRRQLHARAVSALESGGVDRYAELARHTQEAGMLDRAMRYHQLAGEHAQRVFAVDDALQHFECGLAIAEQLGAEAPIRAKDELRYGLAKVLEMIAEPRAVEHYEELIRSAQMNGYSELHWRGLEGLGLVELFVRGDESGIQRYEEGLAVAQAAGDQTGEITLRGRLAIEYATRLDFERARVGGLEALRLARSFGDERLVALALDALKLVAMYLGDAPTVWDVVSELEPLLQRTGELWYLQFLLGEAALVCSAAGRMDDARTRVARALELFARVPNHREVPWLLSVESAIARARGDYARAIEFGQRAVELARDASWTRWMAWADVNLGSVYLDLGAADRAAEHLASGLEESRATRFDVQLLRATALLCSANDMLGDQAARAALFDSASELVRRVRTPPGTAFIWASDAYAALADVHVRAGRGEAGRELLVPILEAAQNARSIEAEAIASLGLAESGDPAYADLAVAAATAGGYPALEWRARAAAGDLDGARQVVASIASTVPDASLRAAFETYARSTLGL